MPLTADDFVQQNTGQPTISGTTFDVTLPAGTSAGNTVLVVVAGPTGTVTPPAGWVADHLTVGQLGVFRRSDVPAGEGVAGSTAWTFTVASGAYTTWWAVELSNMGAEPFDVSTVVSTSVVGNGGTRSTGTTALNSGMTTMQLAVFASEATAAQWGSYTNGFTEVVDVAKSASGPWNLAVARNFTDMATTTYESTATLSTSGASHNAYSMMLVYRAYDSSIVAPLAFHTGFEFGTHGGIANTGATALTGCTFSPTSGTWGTNYLVQAGSARNGNYGLRIVQAAAAGKVAFAGVNGPSTLVFGFNVRVVSASGMVAVASVPFGATLYLLYDSSTTQFGLRWGTSGTPSWQSGTTPLNTWAWCEARLRLNSTVHHADWWIETGTGDGWQTSPADLTGQTAGISITNLGNLNLGHSSAQTMTADFDDLVLTSHYAAFPLGPHIVRLLTPETTGATVSGTSTNFQRFTNNGTLANVNGTEGALLDEVPPTVSASSDGVVQVTAASSDYINLPMTTYTLASDEIIAGVRFLASEWGGTGSGTGTLGWRGHDGTTETTFQAASALYDADSLTAISATYPRWIAAMWSGGASGMWTPTRLGNAAVRMGFSTDATPDMGASAVYLEVATKTITPQRTLTIGDDVFTADVYVHPYNSAVTSYVITNNHPTDSCEFTYSVSGTPQTPVTVTAGNSTTIDIHADDPALITDCLLKGV